MPVTPEHIRTFADRKANREREERFTLHAEAAADAAMIVAMVVDRYEPKRIVQWGSLIDTRRFRKYSDIDLAVEGIVEAERFFALVHDAEGMSRFPLDIVQLEHVEPEYRELILEQGQVVYERSRTDPDSSR